MVKHVFLLVHLIQKKTVIILNVNVKENGIYQKIMMLYAHQMNVQVKKSYIFKRQNNVFLHVLELNLKFIIIKHVYKIVVI